MPAETESLALIIDDPDAMAPAGKVWDHRVVWNIPPDTTSIPEDATFDEAVEGQNDYGHTGYGARTHPTANTPTGSSCTPSIRPSTSPSAPSKPISRTPSPSTSSPEPTSGERTHPNRQRLGSVTEDAVGSLPTHADANANSDPESEPRTSGWVFAGWLRRPHPSMSVTDPVLCPECGWSGDRGELVEATDGSACPSCSYLVEILD